MHIYGRGLTAIGFIDGSLWRPADDPRAIMIFDDDEIAEKIVKAKKQCALGNKPGTAFHPGKRWLDARVVHINVGWELSE